MKINKLLSIVFLAGTISATAQESVIKKIIEIGKTDNQTMHHLDILTNRFGGRMSGSDAYTNAAEWAAHQFKSWGLEVELQEAGTSPVGFTRGHWSGRLIGADQSMTLNFTTPSFTSGTHGVQRGHVLIEPKTKGEFDQMKGRLKGAWVLVSGKSNGWALDWSSKGDEQRATIMEDNRLIREKNGEITKNNRENNTTDPLIELKDAPALFYKEMREAGILGVIQSSAVPIASLYDRAVVKDSTMTFEKLPTTCDIKLDENQYNVIYRMAKERRDIELEFDIRNYFKIGPIKYHSVIGRIKGSTLPNEYVLITCHLDALDMGTGAVDCGSGVSVALEAARMIALSGATPKRTMEFVLFAAEELGLIGAHAYVKAYPERMKSISYLFNRDGGPTPPTGISTPQALYDDMVKVTEPVKQINPDFPFEVTKCDPFSKPSKADGHDGSVFMMEGVPAGYFHCPDFKGYNFHYREIWHTERDIYNKSIPEYQEHAATVTAVVALGIANLKESMNRKGYYKE